MKFRLKSGRKISISIGDKKAGAHRQAKKETYKQVRIGRKRKEMVYKITVQNKGHVQAHPETCCVCSRLQHWCYSWAHALQASLTCALTPLRPTPLRPTPRYLRVLFLFRPHSLRRHLQSSRCHPRRSNLRRPPRAPI